MLFLDVAREIMLSQHWPYRAALSPCASVT